jgi:cytochrome P450
LIRADIEIPPGIILFEDPPIHDIHRGLMSRVFTPKKMLRMEPKIREFCARSLDPLVGSGRLRLHRRPRRPDADAHDRLCCSAYPSPIRRPSATAGRGLRLEEGAPVMSREGALNGPEELFAEYIDWRTEHPSDDLMTELITAEFEDETGTTRRLSRAEVITYISCSPAPATRRPPG